LSKMTIMHLINSNNNISSQNVWIDLESTPTSGEPVDNDGHAAYGSSLSNVTILKDKHTDHPEMQLDNSLGNNLNGDTMNSIHKNNHASKKSLIDFFGKASDSKKRTHAPDTSHPSTTPVSKAKKQKLAKSRDQTVLYTGPHVLTDSLQTPQSPCILLTESLQTPCRLPTDSSDSSDSVRSM
jgi:hypothetical protein